MRKKRKNHLLTLDFQTKYAAMHCAKIHTIINRMCNICCRCWKLIIAMPIKCELLSGCVCMCVWKSMTISMRLIVSYVYQLQSQVLINFRCVGKSNNRRVYEAQYLYHPANTRRQIVENELPIL